MTEHHPVMQVVQRVGDRLAAPEVAVSLAAGRAWWPHHLGHGAVGIVLLHIERAARGDASSKPVQDWLTYIAATTITSGPGSHLNYGAPAVATALAAAAEHCPDPYRTALDRLDRTIAADVQRKLVTIGERLAGGSRPLLADFDVVRGVTGIGGYLLRRTPDSPALREVLSYLVRLTEPAHHADTIVPGWWTNVSPHGDVDARDPEGHGNAGVAHGIAGPLALLALTMRAGITVTGHADAIRTICTWLDRWRVDTAAGSRWPYWITLDEHRQGSRTLGPPRRPSWCYGTAGIARAQQLAALATGDHARQRRAEQVMIDCLQDSAQLGAVIDASLCHGYAGISHVAARMAQDAEPRNGAQLTAAAYDLLHPVQPPDTDPDQTATALLDPTWPGPGLLDGAAGTCLAALTAAGGAPPRSAWDTCLLIA